MSIQYKTIKELTLMLKTKEISNEELIKETFDLIENNSHLNAFITLNKESALNKAKVFGGDVLTATDIAVSNARCKVGTNEVPEIKKNLGKDFITVTPGIRIQQKNDDQSRVATLKEAIKNGSDYIVLGREITASENVSKMIKKVESYIIQNDE